MSDINRAKVSMRIELGEGTEGRGIRIERRGRPGQDENDLLATVLADALSGCMLGGEIALLARVVSYARWTNPGPPEMNFVEKEVFLDAAQQLQAKFLARREAINALAEEARRVGNDDADGERKMEDWMRRQRDLAAVRLDESVDAPGDTFAGGKQSGDGQFPISPFETVDGAITHRRRLIMRSGLYMCLRFTEFRLLDALDERVNPTHFNHTGELLASPTIRELASICGLNEKNVFRQMRLLERWGLVRKVRRPGFQSRVFLLTFPQSAQIDSAADAGRSPRNTHPTTDN